MLRIVESQKWSCRIVEYVTTKKSFFSVPSFPVDMIDKRRNSRFSITCLFFLATREFASKTSFQAYVILFSRFLLTNVDKRAFEQESDLSGGLLQFSDKNCRLFQTETFLATEGLYCELFISAIDVNYSGTCNVVTEHPNRGLETRPLKALFIKTSRATLSENFRIYFLEIIVFRDRQCVQTASRQTRHQS